MKLSRRHFLGSSTTIGAAALLGGAGPQAKGALNLGFMVWRIGEILDFDEQVAWVKEAGFESISFHASPGTPGKWRGIDPQATGPEERRRIRDLIDPFAMCEIHAPFEAKLEPETPEKILSMLETTLAFAGDVGATIVTVHANPPALDTPETPQAWNDALDRLDKAAARAGARIGIEFNTGFEWLRKPRRDWIAATLDVGHMYFGDGAGYRPYESIDGQIRWLDDLLVHMHLHDYDGKVDHIEVGTGRVEFDAVLKGLSDIAYTGAICLELNPDRVTPEGIKRSAANLRHRAAVLKGVQRPPHAH